MTGFSRPPAARKSESSWMITFADLLSLLLTFFVLLFSMNTIEFDNWKAVVTSMSDEFNQSRPQIDLKPKDTTDRLKKPPELGLNLNYLRVLFERSFQASPLFKDAVVHKVGDRVLISLPAEAFFTDKNIDLKPGAIEPLRQLAGTLIQIRNEIQVVGYTDNRQIKSPLYRSNWGLSVARARKIAGILTDFGYRQTITVLGYGSAVSRAADSEGLDGTGKFKAERIDIVILAGSRKDTSYDIF